MAEGFSNNNVASAEEVECQECMDDEETSVMSDPSNKNESSPNSESSAGTPVVAELSRTFPDTDEDSESYYTPEKLAALKRILASTTDRGQGTARVEMVEDSEAESCVESVNSSICSCRCPHHPTRVNKESLPSNFIKMHEKYHRPDFGMKTKHKTPAGTHSATRPSTRHGVRFSSIGFREGSDKNNNSVTRHHPNQTDRRSNKNNNACFGLVSLNQVIFTTGKVLDDKLTFGLVPPKQSIRSQPERNREPLSDMVSQAKDLGSNAYSPTSNITKKCKEKIDPGRRRRSQAAEDCCITVIPDDAEPEPQCRNHDFNEMANNNFSSMRKITLESNRENLEAPRASIKSSSSDPRRCKSKQNLRKNSATKKPLRIPMRKCTRQNIDKILKYFRP